MHIASGGVGVGLGRVVARHGHLHRFDDQLVLLLITDDLDAVETERNGLVVTDGTQCVERCIDRRVTCKNVVTFMESIPLRSIQRTDVTSPACSILHVFKIYEDSPDQRKENLLFPVGNNLFVALEPLDRGARVVGVNLHHDLALLNGLHRLQLPGEPDRSI